jgi:hypothetical protein
MLGLSVEMFRVLSAVGGGMYGCYPIPLNWRMWRVKRSLILFALTLINKHSHSGSFNMRKIGFHVKAKNRRFGGWVRSSRTQANPKAA